ARHSRHGGGGPRGVGRVCPADRDPTERDCLWIRQSDRTADAAGRHRHGHRGRCRHRIGGHAPWPGRGVSARVTDQSPRANPLSRVDAKIVGLRLGFQLIGPLAPERAARFAEGLFTRPPQHPLRPQEEAFLETGEPFHVPHDGHELAGWSWGTGPVVLLMHGWGSRAGRFRLFVPELLARGFRAVAFDGPGHGRTGGTSASLPQFAAALAAVSAVVGPVDAFIGHSLGAAAALFAMNPLGWPEPAVIG